jgi:hypothetical protein
MATRITTAAAAVAFLAGGPVLAAGAAAQQPAASPAAPQSVAHSDGSGGWAAWIGCWRPTDEDAPLNALVCVVPGETAGSVRMLSLEDGAVVDESVVHADGRPRGIEEGGCTGTETASWSRDGRRVFMRGDLNCDGVQRVSTGVIAMIAENEWIDAQAVAIGEQHATRAIRYRAVPISQVPAVVAALLPADRQLVQQSARIHAAGPLDIEAVVEASGAVAAPALEALLAARQHGFSLNAARLAELERRGVPVAVIDMMVALSHPEVFAVQQRQREPAAGQDAWGRAGIGMRYSECADPRFARMRVDCDPFYAYGSSRYGYGYGSRFGYSPWGYDRYGWHYGPTPVVVIVRPDDSGTSTGGEVVRGRGYTSGGAAGTGRSAQPREPRPAASGASQGGSATQPAATTGSSSSGTSSGTSTGRTAVPRGGGGQTEDPTS